MRPKKKERLYISDIIDDPAISYPAYYIVSTSLHENEMLHAALSAIHAFDFSYYHAPKSFDEIFKMFDFGQFPIYKEKYVVGYFGNKMMYLESNGWRAMPVTREVVEFHNWLVCT